MALVRVKLVLTECRTGQTVILGKYQFVDGHTYVQADEKTVNGLVKYLGRCYKAYPEGSQALREAQTRWSAYLEKRAKESEGRDGTGEISESSEQGSPVEIPGGVQPSREESEDKSSDDGGGTTNSAEGDTGPIPNGDGHQDSRILEAVNKLDHGNDEHWTAGGSPRIDAVEQLSGVTGLTRARVQAAAPNVVRKIKTK